MTTPFVSLRSRSTWYFALVLAIYLFTGCNNFWTPCTEEGVVCTTFTDGGGTEDGKPDPPPDPNKPIGPSRKFEWRAKVQLDPNKLKYVGMKGTTPVFLANEDTSTNPDLPLRWVALQLDLLQDEDHKDQRIKPDMNRTGFPMAPSHDFLNSRILVSGGSFYGLFSGDKTIRFVEPRAILYELAKLPDSPQYVYFRHPQISGLAVSAKPTISGANSATLVRWEGDETTLIQSANEPVTALVMGDLDATDSIPTGQEAILLRGRQVQEIWHQGDRSGTPRDDPKLRDGLQEVMDRNDKQSPILAGFVTDLNNDKLVDFVYVRGLNVYVTSYRGRSPSGLGLFADWPKDSFPKFNGEVVKSIQAIDLTKEGYPELVVETDQAVHFYLSIP